MSIWAYGDWHGNYKALQQIFERAPIKKGDTLISLGDCVDGWSEVFEGIELMISMEKDYKMINLKGNHDEWFKTWLDYGQHPCIWQQGGIGTLKSYCNSLNKLYYNMESGGYSTNLIPSDIPQSHINFFKKQKLYYIDHENRFYVHGGFNRREYIDYQHATKAYNFYWDRDLWNQALSCADNIKLKTNDDFKEIFIGHTQTCHLDKNECKPINKGGVYNLDQGAGWSGKLTIMDVSTKEYFQSDYSKELYPNEKGRE